ncbi:MAG: hypothetical protein AB7E60_05990 [Sphingobium sp.]
MGHVDHLARRKQAALNHAGLANCPVEKRRHEEQARAYSKIIAVLRREQQASPHAR